MLIKKKSKKILKLIGNDNVKNLDNQMILNDGFNFYESGIFNDDGDDLEIPNSIPLNKQYLYKTEFCRSWMENRTCKYGDKCQFAHGLSELRRVNRHPKYKTEICKAFHESGSCPFGTRCRFVHFAPDENLKVKVKSEKEDSFSGSSFEKYFNLNEGSRLPFFRKLRSRQHSGKM